MTRGRGGDSLRLRIRTKMDSYNMSIGYNVKINREIIIRYSMCTRIRARYCYIIMNIIMYAARSVRVREIVV